MGPKATNTNMDNGWQVTAIEQPREENGLYYGVGSGKSEKRMDFRKIEERR